ncbi:hypothetical protein HYT74_02960 [Candidatus Daviesbacteria bacterium]|nr:hypothetical protein [Candidatus Daviesbacteria bacterium]MBI4038574.1 hypothetical protein [Candidatus Daviesbacteria bacterium]
MIDSYLKCFFGIYLIIGLIWARSSLEKIFGGEFVDSLGGILTKVAQANPYLWYKNFLIGVVTPNSQIFANLTMWGEFLTAVSISAGAIYLLLSKTKERASKILLLGGLIGGMFLNTIFWLGFAYTSPATDTLNLLMLLIELLGAVVLIKDLTYPL